MSRIEHDRTSKTEIAEAIELASNKGPCAFCGKPAEGNHTIHRDGFCIGPEVPLCDACGSHLTPTCEEIWDVIAQ